MADPNPRRDRFPHRRAGTGRMTTPRTVALAVSGNFGRRTGVQIRSNIPKGADGFDNINEFWDEGGKEAETEVPTIIEKVSSPPARKSLPRKPNATPSPAGPSNNAIASAMSPQASAQGPSPSTPVANFDAVDFDPPASAQPEKEATPVESAKKTSFKPPRKSTKPLFSSGDADTEPDEKVDAAAPAPPVPARKSGGRKSKVTPLKPVVEAKEEEDEEVEVEKGGKGKQTSPAVPLRRTSGVRRKSVVVEKTPVRRAIVSDVESGPSEGEEEVEKPVKGKGVKRAVPASDSEDEEQEDEEEFAPDTVERAIPETPGNAVLAPNYDMRRLRKSTKKTGRGEEEEEGAVRHSTRRRWPVLAHWKGERVVYTAEGALHAESVGVLTPDLEEQRRVRHRAMKAEGSGGARKKPRAIVKKDKTASASGEPTAEEKVVEEEAPFMPPAHIKESESAAVTYKPNPDAEPLRVSVMRRRDQLRFQELPGSDGGSGGVVPVAAAAFSCPEFISGVMSLAPNTRKEEESTAMATQVFYVAKGQPKALQVDVGPRIFFLSPGDHFFVPLSTTYRLENHSSSTTSEVSFVVVNSPNSAE